MWRSGFGLIRHRLPCYCRHSALFPTAATANGGWLTGLHREFETLALRTDEANRNWRLMDNKSDASSTSQPPAYEATKQTLVFIVLIFVLHSTKIYGPWDHAKNMYREDAQPLLLVGAEA